MMQIISRKTIRSISARAVLFLAASTSVMAIAAEEPSVPSPVGMAGEVMSSGFLMQFASGLAIVLVLIIGLAFMMRRFGRLQSSANGALRMIDGMALSTRERIVLVQVGNKQVLLGVAPGRVEAVHVLDEPVPTGVENEAAGSNFASRLRDALGVGQ